MVKIIKDDDFVVEDWRLVSKILLVKKSKEFPQGYKFKFQFMVFKDNEWKDIVRIDNHKHGKFVGRTHIHKFGSKITEEINIPLENIEEYIINLGLKLNEEIKNEN